MDLTEIVADDPDESLFENNNCDSDMDIGITVDCINGDENYFEVSYTLESDIYIHHATEAAGEIIPVSAPALRPQAGVGLIVFIDYAILSKCFYH